MLNHSSALLPTSGSMAAPLRLEPPRPGGAPRLPLLREELALHPGPDLADGQPSWTLQDPVRHQFFRIDWLSFEILSRWALDDLQRIADDVQACTTLRPQADDVQAFAQFLIDNQLVQPRAADSAQQLAARLQRARGNAWTWLLHHYLFFRIPLARPDRWLDRALPWVAPLYSRSFARLSLLALLIGLVEVYRDWGRFSATLVDTFSWGGLLGYGLALSGAKLMHELGHAFTAKRYGCRVPTMGLAFLVLWPMAYTDTNEVWKLRNARQRLAVAGAGIATELLIAVWATLAWSLLPDGGLRSAAFMLATTTWLATVAINSSPFMRFDGYFLLSDALDMPNLHGRAFALARWQLRESLFKLGLPPPETFSRQRRRGLILFAYATWLYRLVVFLGIAVLVYGFFIKAVGVLLFVLELLWFVALPLWREIKLWPALLRQRAGAADGASSWTAWARAWRRPLLLLGLLLLALLLPWPQRQTSSGLLKPTQVMALYAPAGARLQSLPWAEGAPVAAGQLLLELDSPELQLRQQKAKARLERLRWQASLAGVDQEQRRNLGVLQQEEDTARAELANLQAELAQYRPQAPFKGVLRDINPELQPGTWVARRERLALLVNPQAWQVETWLDEEAVRRIAVGNPGRFRADGLEGPPIALQVLAIDRDATRQLPGAELSLAQGGSIATRDQQGQHIPEHAVYRVVLQASAPPPGMAAHSWRGQVLIEGEWEAPGLRYARAALVLLWRELGF